MKHLVFAAALLLAVFSSCSPSAHVLFDGGKSDYVIVVDSQASECERYAAQELQDFLEKVGGVRIPIRDLSGGKKGRRLVVGYNELTRQLIKDVQEPDGMNDALAYESKGGDICFWGDTDRGTLYSVYSFLEQQLDCRWYNSRVSVIPPRDSWSFTSLKNHEVPALRMRNDFYRDVIAHPDFAARMRSNSTFSNPVASKYGGSVNYWSAHTLVTFVSVDEYFDSHPEYFSQIDGRRIKDKAQLCLSNPDVLRLVIDAVKEKMRTSPEYLVYSVSQGDYENPCQCEECQKIKARYGGEESGILLWFINQVADAVREEFPDKLVGTFAYWYTRKAPRNIRPRDNVVIRLCSIEECQLHDFDSCEQNHAFVEDLKDWSAIAPQLFIWDYTTVFSNYMLPLPNVWTFQNRICKFVASHAIGLMEQGSYQETANAFEDMKAYVLSKLMWNPECDVNAVIQDFTDGFFGSDAGPFIREYLDFEREMLSRDDIHQNCYPQADSPMYSDEFVTKGRTFFSRAKDAVRQKGGVQEQEYIARIEYAEVALCYLELLRHPKEGVQDGALDLFKRVVEREGISLLREQGYDVDEFIKDVQNGL